MSILNNALTGALASQLALSSSSQNIANLQTTGYTRQSAVLATIGAGLDRTAAGNGVQVTGLARYADDYKTQQLWRSASDLGARSQNQPYLTQLEKVLGDDSANLSGGIDQFFAALNAVAGVDPSSTPLRQQVVTAAGLLGERFNSLNNVFAAQLQSLRQQRSAIVDSANAELATIASLNTQITQSHASGANVSSLIDARDQAIDGLASQFGLEVADQPDGSRNVSLRGGQSLVLGGVAGKLSVSGGADQVFSLTLGSTALQLDPLKAGGQLGGLTAYEQQVLRPMIKGVEDLASEISSRVNTQLASGYRMDGSAGTPLFAFTAGGGADLLKVTDGFQTADLGFSGDGTPGDTGNLQKILGIKNQEVTITGLGPVMIGDADAQMVGQLAVQSQQNKAALTTAQTVRSQAEQDWQATSGVNQDEEAVHLVEYQNMYQANMKVLAVANALFDATLQMMG
jgi:flagellar hook-associated protein 1 FlgK